MEENTKEKVKVVRDMFEKYNENWDSEKNAIPKELNDIISNIICLFEDLAK